MNKTYPYLAQAFSLSGLAFFLLLSGCGSTQSTARHNYDPPGQANLDPIPHELQKACDTRIPPLGVAPDVEGVEPSPSEIEATRRLNQKPPRRISYLGTRGVLFQKMRAIPDNPACSMGSPLVIGRPLQGDDQKHNKNCCPPGLYFESGTGTEILGSPTHPGTFDTEILLCGYCRDASIKYWHPIRAQIHWEITGKKPRRLK